MQSATPASPVSKTALWAGRTISVLVSLFLLFDGAAKVMMVPDVVEASEKLQVPLGVVPGIGIVLIACTVVYLVPTTSVLGAILLTGYLGGATATHVRAGDGAFPTAFAVGFGVLVWVGLFLRDDRLRTLIPLRRERAARPTEGQTRSDSKEDVDAVVAPR